MYAQQITCLTYAGKYFPRESIKHEHLTQKIIHKNFQIYDTHFGKCTSIL